MQISSRRKLCEFRFPVRGSCRIFRMVSVKKFYLRGNNACVHVFERPFFQFNRSDCSPQYLILLALQIYIVNNINVYRLENVIASIRLFTFARSCPLPSFPSKEIRSIRVTRLGRITRRFISRLIARYHFPYFIFRRHFKRKEKILAKNSSNRKFSRSVRSGKSA